MEYFCLNCKNKLIENKRKFCDNKCKCKYFYKKNPKKCNLWNKNHPKQKVNKKCLTCGKDCGRKKYCSEKCKPKRIQIKPYWKGMIRLNAKCYVCNETFQVVHIHHKDGNHDNNEKSNLINLCHPCHTRIHHPEKENKIKNEKEDRSK